MPDLNLNLNDGREKIYINKEKYGEKRVIWINPTDINIFVRAEKASKNIDEYIEKCKEESVENADDMLDILRKTDDYIRKQVDYIFDYKASEAVFGKTSPTADVGGGKVYIQAFLEAIMPVIESKMNKQADTVSKYTKKYVK